MKLKIKMEDCKFYVNEAEGVVVCVYEDAEKLLEEELFNNYYWLWDMVSYKESRLPRTFRGKAVCSPDDVWDEEVGRRLAFYRMRTKLLNSYFNIAQHIVDKTSDYLDNFVEDINHLGNRMDRVQYNLMESIKKQINE